MTQIWALYRQSGSDRLEKQPTDLRRHHHYMRDDALRMTIQSQNDGIQSRTQPSEFVLMGAGQFVEYFDATGGETDIHLATVSGAGDPYDQFLCYQPIDQSYGTVMRDLELFSKFSDRRGIAPWKSLDGEDSLVLAGRYPGGSSCRFAEAQELPETITKCGQLFILCLGHAGGSSLFTDGHSSEV